LNIRNPPGIYDPDNPTTRLYLRLMEINVRRNVLKNLFGLALAANVGVVSIGVVSIGATLSGCGFQLRGQSAMPFSAAYVDAPEASNLASALRRSLSSQRKLAPTADIAPVRIKLDDESYSKNILALSGGGKVREYRLEYQVQLSVFDKAGKVLVEPTKINLSNDFSYSDDQVLAKAAEETSLNRSMEQDALRQILRRLSYLK
jgi:LPS-assembly lipoprotein